MFQYLIQGYLIGIAYVAPIGTQNLFMINYALTQRRSRVLLAAAIAAFFDITLALACFFGIGALMSTSLWVELPVVLIGSLVVIYIGISLIRSHSSMEENDKTDISLWKLIGTLCVVTWFNPQALVDGSMLLGASKGATPDQYGDFFILGCVLALASWWGIMPMTFNLVRAKVNDRMLRGINIGCGIFIVCYGIKLLYSGITLMMTVI